MANMAALAKAGSVWFLIASVSYVFCLPKRDVMKRGAHVVDVTTPNPNNQTQTGADGGAIEDVQSATPTPYPQNQTAEVTDERLSEDAATTITQTRVSTARQTTTTKAQIKPVLSIAVGTDAEQTQIVKKHNTLRRGVSPTASNMLKMRWNSEAAANAQRWADTCSLTHSDSIAREVSGISCGENLYMASYKNSWSNAIQTWYDEVRDFKYGNGSINGGTVGHYTQVVAYRSDQLGCAMAYCPNSRLKYFYVCQYCPPRKSSQDTKPYKSGTSCGDCPHACENNLCTNPCPYVDQYDNCPNLKKQWGCDNEHVASWCPASCTCINQIV